MGLWWFGHVAKNVYGTTRFLAIYFVSGALSGVTHALLQPLDPAVGASGAVMGVFGAVLAAVFRLKSDLPERIRNIELSWMAGLALAQVVLDQIIPQVAAFAHLGGLVSGFIIGLIVDIPVMRRRPSDGTVEGER